MAGSTALSGESPNEPSPQLVAHKYRNHEQSIHVILSSILPADSNYSWGCGNVCAISTRFGSYFFERVDAGDQAPREERIGGPGHSRMVYTHHAELSLSRIQVNLVTP